MTTTQAKAILVGQLHRIKTTTEKYRHRLRAVTQFNKIANFLGYRTNTLRKALEHVYHTTGDKHWHNINKDLH